MSNPDIASRFDEIYDSTSKPVLAFITAKCGRTDDIKDVFQDTFLELYQVLHRRGADYVTNELALVLKIAKRKVAKYYSLRERLKMLVSINSAAEDGEESRLLDFDTNAFQTEDFAVSQALLDDARRFLRAKPENVQKVFYLMYDLDMTIPEIARALSMSESNVKNKLYRTLKELRQILS